MPRYGDPYANLSNTMTDLTRNLIALKGQQVNQLLSEAELAMRGNQFAETERVNKIRYGAGTPGQPDFVPGMEQRRLQVSEAAVPEHKKIFNPSDNDRVRIATATRYGKKAVETLQPVFDMADQIASVPGTTRKDAYAGIKSAWPELRQGILENLKKVDVSKLDPDEQEKFLAYKDAVIYDETGENHLEKGFFINTYNSMKQEEESSKATLEAAKIQGRLMLTAPDRVTFNSLVNRGMDPIEALRQVEATKKEGKFSPNIYLGEKPEKKEAREYQRSKDVRETGRKIELNASNPAMSEDADFYNANSTGPNVFVWKENKVFPGGKYEKVKLPVINGKQVTAQDIHYTATQNNLTTEEVLAKIGALK